MYVQRAASTDAFETTERPKERSDGCKDGAIGMDTWRQLRTEFMPRSGEPGKNCSTSARSLKPAIGTHELGSNIHEVEGEVLAYESMMQSPVDPEFKAITLTKIMPAELDAYWKRTKTEENNRYRSPRVTSSQPGTSCMRRWGSMALNGWSELHVTHGYGGPFPLPSLSVAVCCICLTSWYRACLVVNEVMLRWSQFSCFLFV